jgi:hypothetical protein
MEIAQYLLDLAGVLVFLAIAVAPRLISMNFAVRSLESSLLKNEKENRPRRWNWKQREWAILAQRDHIRFEDTY